MPARVFISCGQRQGEREVAGAIAAWLRGQGFYPYVALDAQSVQDVDSGIIGELRRSDFYVFVDFRRECIGKSDGRDGYRGSLFSHQELAIAYTMQFEHVLFFRQRGVRLEGICAFIASNAKLFDDPSDVPALVAAAVEQRKWRTEYSRNLVIGQLRLSDEIVYYGGSLRGRFLYVDVENRRPDVGAHGAVARLSALCPSGGARGISPNRSPLKVTGQSRAFQQTIWPRSHGPLISSALTTETAPSST
jgi:hypothetical protein